MVKVELSVPSNLESIELWQYQKYMGVVETNKDQEATEFLNLKLVEIFCGVSLKDVSSINMKDFNKITEIIGNAFAEKTPLIRHFELDGIEFGFVPNLDKISIGEYIDIESNLSGFKNMHKAMAVLYRPVTKKHKEKYQVEEYVGHDEYAEAMKYMPLNAALGAMVFFYRLEKDLLNTTLKCLEEEKDNKQIIQALRRFQVNGDGISQFTDLLEEKLSTSIKRLKFLHIKQ
jgi:hypothetical protein